MQRHTSLNDMSIFRDSFILMCGPDPGGEFQSQENLSRGFESISEQSVTPTKLF